MTPRELHEVKLAEKKALRQKMLAFRKGLTKEQHEAKSRAILARLYEEPRFQQAKTIFAYASMPDEVQLYDLLAHALREGKRVGLPLITGKGLMEAVNLPSLAALVPGKFGILTVRKEEQRIIPADEVDRYLMEKAPQAYRAALTFDGQVVASVPMEAHDAKVNLILTETRRIEPNT